MSIFPYAYRMIQTFDITNDETQISIYAGMLITAFAFAEFSTGVIWGRISDRIGRKPVLLLGLCGTALSMILFGFSRSLPTAIIARALGGLLNGNVGVLQTTVAELVTSKEQQPRAFSIMPFVWCLGSIIGPAMGGALAMPCESYPWLFPRGGWFDRYPFLLPNLVCVFILICGVINGFLFLEETHPAKKSDRNYGLEVGNYMTKRVTYLFSGKHAVQSFADQTASSDDPPGYQSNEGSPLLPAKSTIDSIETGRSEKLNQGVSKTFTRPVILIIASYAILAYHSVSFDALMPIFMSEPRSDIPPSLPFKFTGGFALSTKTIGVMMAVQGFYSMIAQLWLFPFLIRRFGTIHTFRVTMMVWPLLYLIVPYLIFLPTSLQTTGIYFALLVKITFHVIAFPSCAILLTNAAPSKAILGTINGVAASSACLARSFGPTLTGSIHALGLRFGCNGLAWWFAGLVCALGAMESFMIEEVDGSCENTVTEEDHPPPEPLMHCAVEATEEASPRRDSLDHDTLKLADMKN